MKNENAIKELNRMKMDMSHTGAEYNAIMTAISSLQDDKLKRLEKYISNVKQSLKTENTDYYTGYMSALSNIEGEIEILRRTNDR